MVSQCLIHCADVTQCPCTTFIAMQVAETDQRKVKVTQSVIISSIPATDFSQEHLHPCLALRVRHRTEQVQRLLCMLTGLAEIALFPAQHRQFIKRPACLGWFILFAMQRQAACETTHGLSIPSQ